MMKMEKKSFRKYLTIGTCVIATVLLFVIVSGVMDFFVNDRSYRISFVASSIEKAFDKVEPTVGEFVQTFEHDDSKFKGIMHVTVTKSFAGEVEDVVKGVELSRYYNYAGQNKDLEIALFPAEYMPWVKAAGYGWLNDDGNLYAQMFGAEAAEGKPNYRNKFSFVARKGEIYYQVTGFCDTRDFELFIEKAVELINENFVTEQS